MILREPQLTGYAANIDHTGAPSPTSLRGFAEESKKGGCYKKDSGGVEAKSFGPFCATGKVLEV
jgi:hypothetical protein